MTERSRLLVGGSIAACAIAMFFWWGTRFAVFGSDIDWIGRPEQLVMPLLLALGGFGAGYAAGGARLGAKALVWTGAILGIAILFGSVRAAIWS